MLDFSLSLASAIALWSRHSTHALKRYCSSRCSGEREREKTICVRSKIVNIPFTVAYIHRPGFPSFFFNREIARVEAFPLLLVRHSFVRPSDRSSLEENKSMQREGERERAYLYARVERKSEQRVLDRQSV